MYVYTANMAEFRNQESRFETSTMPLQILYDPANREHSRIFMKIAQMFHHGGTLGNGAPNVSSNCYSKRSVTRSIERLLNRIFEHFANERSLNRFYKHLKNN
jgi:hypothetical protein